jgi:hypothetical protein
MKPEELDDLFRRGLSEQHAAPRPNAWAAIQQRMTDAAQSDADDDDDLPAFLRGEVPSVGTPAPAPFMTAARGGAAFRAPAATLTVSWWQRPIVRAAAAVVLLIGGGALAIQHIEPLHSAPATLAIAPTSLAPTNPTTVTPPTQAPTTTPTPVAEQPSASLAVAATTPQAAEPVALAAVAAPVQSTAIVAQTKTMAPVRHVAHNKTVGVAKSSEAAFASRSTDAADTTEASAAKWASAARRKAARTADLLPADDVLEVTIRPAVEPAPEMAASFASNRMTQADETVEIGGGTVGQLVSRAAGRRSGGIISPNALFRRASGRVLEILDRADHSADGQLTIETSLAGRPVRKTISL